MNPLPGEIFLDEEFPLRSGQTKLVYIMVVCNTPEVSDSVLIALINPFADDDVEIGPDWEWPERFVLSARNNPLNRATEVMIDDVYQARSHALTHRCRFIGSFDTQVTAAILRALCESPGVARIHADSIRDIAMRLNPDH